MFFRSQGSFVFCLLSFVKGKDIGLRLKTIVCCLLPVVCCLSSVFASTITTGIMLTPTGELKKQKAGFGGELGLIYYIGDIIRKDKSETSYLNPIKSFYFFVDGRASPLSNPAIAIGGEGFVVLQGSQPEGEYKMGGGGNIGTETQVFGFFYLVLSKQLSIKNGASFGLLYGPIDKIFNPIIHNLDLAIEEENLAYFISCNTNLFKRGFGIEVIKPKNSNYFLINTSIDRFLGFSLSYLKGPSISSLIGYFGIRLNIL
ncbi:MAG: hypothetical protein AB1297_06295 [bacterium]